MFSVHSCVNVFPHVGFLNLSCNKKEKIITFCLVFGLFLFFFLFFPFVQSCCRAGLWIALLAPHISAADCDGCLPHSVAMFRQICLAIVDFTAFKYIMFGSILQFIPANFSISCTSHLPLLMAIWLLLGMYTTVSSSSYSALCL